MAPSPKRREDFSVEGFLQFLDGYSISDTVVSIAGSKRKAQALYQAFVQGRNFLPWVSRLIHENPADGPEPGS